jgi:hypothetical protein
VKPRHLHSAYTLLQLGHVGLVIPWLDIQHNGRLSNCKKEKKEKEKSNSQ